MEKLWIAKFNHNGLSYVLKASTYSAKSLYPEAEHDKEIFITINKEVKDNKLETIHTVFRLKTIEEVYPAVDQYFENKVDSIKFAWKQSDYRTKSE